MSGSMNLAMRTHNCPHYAVLWTAVCGIVWSCMQCENGYFICPDMCGTVRFQMVTHATNYTVLYAVCMGFNLA